MIWSLNSERFYSTDIKMTEIILLNQNANHCKFALFLIFMKLDFYFQAAVLNKDQRNVFRCNHLHIDLPDYG